MEGGSWDMAWGPRKTIMDQGLLWVRHWASTAQASSRFIFKSGHVGQVRTLLCGKVMGMWQS